MSGKLPNNPWKMGGGKIKPQKSNPTPSLKDVEKRFEEARAKMQANVHRHIQEYESSSEEEDIPGENILEKVLQNYSSADGDAAFNRTRNFLEESFQTGASVCLICIATVKRSDPIWNCASCFTFFHLTCIQRWAQDTITQQMEEEQGVTISIRVHTFRKIEWCCPKCRQSYEKEEIPKKYECFCGQQSDPPYQPWLLPHSCGDICRKNLQPECGHKCLLLCHPGPCPPCPKMVVMKCHCGQSPPRTVRCSASKWSCGKFCGRILACKQHKCEQSCHEGECSPCQKTSTQSCLCGAEKMARPCAEPNWHCEKSCGRSLSCGHHVCEKICHSPTDCGDCPLSGYRSCPCGSVTAEVECPAEVQPCGDTCGKPLPCGQHQCVSKCHKDACPPCAVVVEKRCRCGANTKELPCSKEFTCETKCKRNRNCSRHPCPRKCCPGKCPPCERQCQKQLKCKKHRCAAPCHSGPCYPCPLVTNVTCRCTKTYVTVPCGRQRKVKPPNCSLPCKIPYPCGHLDVNTHKCHFGSCPPCKGICKQILPNCGHECAAICHEAVVVTFKQTEKPATPWEVKPARVEILKMSCPPCEKPLRVSCFGFHTSEGLPCHTAKGFNCGRKCGALLLCGNHSCELPCHPKQDIPEMNLKATPCGQCTRDCLRPRPQGCTHLCPIGRCHVGACLPCARIVRARCHCGINEIKIKCSDLQKALVDEDFKEDAYTCNQQCIHNLKCGHRCRNVCHSGECSPEQVCTKKTKIYCPCKGLKREVQCNLATSKKATLNCNAICAQRKEQEHSAKLMEEIKKIRAEEERNRRELEEYEAKFGGKKRNKERKRDDFKRDERKKSGWVPVALAVVVGIVAAMVFIYIGFYDEEN